MVALFLAEDGSDDEGLLLAMAAMDSNMHVNDIDDDDACNYRSKSVIGIGIDYLNTRKILAGTS